MRQTSLFDDPRPASQKPISRGSDPSTSKIAEEEIRPKLGLLQKRMLAAAIDAPMPCTAQELAEYASDNPREVESLRKRAKELVRVGLLREHRARECRITGKKAMTYLPTKESIDEEGR